MADTIDALLEENRRLERRNVQLEKDIALFREAALGMPAAVERGRAEERELLTRRFEADARGLRAQIESLTAEVRTTSGREPLLDPDIAAGLVERLVHKLSSGVPELRLSSSELRLKVAFGQVGALAGFVVPTSESGPDLQNRLHEVVLRFERGPVAPTADKTTPRA